MVEESTTLTIDTTNNATDLFSVEFILSNKKHILERQVYTLFALIGDFGGFNGAIIIFPSLFMSFYSSSLFHASLLEDLPVRQAKKKEGY